MGFPGSDGIWSSVAGAAIFPGADGSLPGIWSAVAIALCVVVLVVGNAYESKKYKG